MVEAEMPKRMEIGRSDSIRVSLVWAAGETFVPTIEIQGHMAITATLVPVGTPGVPLRSAFGPQYEIFAIAYLGATAFDVKPVAPEEQPLEQPKVTWEWNIIPKSDGPQLVNLSIEILWKPKGDGPVIQRQIWRRHFQILVKKPWITTGQISFLTLLTGFLGSGLSIPWIYERIKAAGKKGEKQERVRGELHE
jgi:hypothetical protein